MSRARRRRSRGRLAAHLLVVLAVFLIGVALGASLDDNPSPGTTTFDRTLTVVTLTPTSP